MRTTLTALMVLATFVYVGVPAFAATEIELRGSEENGFGRAVFEWPRAGDELRVPAHRASITSGVLVLTFAEPFDVDLAELVSRMPRYVALVRQDIDKQTLRIAMKASFSVDVKEALNELYVHFLPPNWRGAAPSLPAAAVARIQAEEERRAAEAMAKEAAKEAEIVATGPPGLRLRVGEHPSFSRLVFDWNQPVLYSMIQQEGSITLTFDRAAEVSLTQLRVDPPPFIQGVSAETVDGRLVVRIATEPGAIARDFREDLSVVLDVEPAPSSRVASAAARPDTTQEVVEQPVEQGVVGMTPEAIDAALVAEQQMAAGEAETAESLETATSEVQASIAEAKASERQLAEEIAPEEPDRTLQPAVAAPDAFANVDDDERVPPISAVAEVAETPEVAAAPEVADAAEAAEQEAFVPDSEPAEIGTQASEWPADPAAAAPRAADATGNEQPMLVQAELMGDSVRLVFPWADHVGAAVFERAGQLWVVFDRDTEFDLSEIGEGEAEIIGYPEIVALNDGSALTFDLPKRLLITASEKDTHWVVMVGDVLLEPAQAIKVARKWRESGEARVTMDLEVEGAVRWIADPVVKDEFAAVTARGPARGLLTRLSFVEFQALATAQGLAFVPLADDLSVRVNRGWVNVTREQGLLLSSRSPGTDAAPTAIFDVRRPGFMDFVEWRKAPGATYLEQNQRFLARLAAAQEDDLERARIDYAKFLLSQKLAPEALGVLQLVEEADPDLVFSPAYRSLRGVAYLMAGLMEEATADLAIRALARDRHAALWRAVAFAERGMWREARADFELGETSIEAYEPDLQAMFRTIAAETALLSGELDVVSFQLDEIPEDTGDTRWLARAELARGAMLERQDSGSEALEIYDTLVDHPHRQIAARARYARATLMRAMDASDDDELYNELERLRFTWRGDELELMVLARLGRLQIARDEIAAGLATMRTAVSLYYDTELARQLASEMTDVFASLFIDGKADEMRPITALSLYYDFRELTPIGRRGDEMIRRLADRLVAVDLLEQAAELLQHQVDHRLRGVGRSQVAMRLASIYLLDREPERALAAIRTTRQALLPKALVEGRHLLEARALSELRRYDHALELISELSGPEVEALRADVLWAAKRWPDAAAQIELVLGESWSDGGPLDAEDRFQVMRAAVAYTLADDEMGLRRLSSKFGSKMRASPDAESFTIVTRPVEQENVQFRELAAKIADIDTLDRFLAKFREGYRVSLDRMDDAPAGATAIN